MLHDAKRLLSRFLRKAAQARTSPPAPPTFREEQLFAHLRAPVAAAQAWRAGRREAAWRSLIDHFRDRAPTLGFVDPARVADLIAEADSRFPNWRSRLLAKVHEDRDLGLSVYDRRAGPLSASFDWGGSQCGPAHDRLYAARPHRFGFVPRWALACHYEPALVGDLEGVLSGWMASAEAPGGHPGFKSSHVVVYQLIALLLAWPFLAALARGEDDDTVVAVQRRALRILYEASRFMRAVDGSGVANNHRLAERLADWLAAVLLPEFDHALSRDEAEAAWLDELHRQTYPDGGSFEHSVHYQEHACELAVIYLLLSRRNGWPVPQRTLARIERMLHFQLAMAGPALIPLAVGNTTEDPLLALGVAEGWQCGLLREVQRACFAADAAPAADEDPTRETAFWLLDGALIETTAATAEEPAFDDFPDSGFCVFEEPKAGARLVFRLGPTPAAPGIGGHSHGDLLSIMLSGAEGPILAPPGTGSYRFRPSDDLPGQPNLRAEFASPSCRSGLFIHGLEPYGPLKGDFRNWALPCQVEARRASSPAAGLSWAEGTVVGEGPYVGQRRGVVHVWDFGWLIYDQAPPLRPELTASVGWQFAPGVACRLEKPGRVVAESVAAAAPLHLLHHGTGEATILRGSFNPFRGWVSPSYGCLVPAANLRFRLAGDRPRAAFVLTFDAAAAQLEQVVQGESSIGFRIMAAEEETLALIAAGEGAATAAWADVAFHGRLLCMRRRKNRVSVRALGLTRLTAASWNIDLAAGEAADFELLLMDGEAAWPRGECPQLRIGPAA